MRNDSAVLAREQIEMNTILTTLRPKVQNKQNKFHFYSAQQTIFNKTGLYWIIFAIRPPVCKIADETVKCNKELRIYKSGLGLHSKNMAKLFG